jgi:multiple sugar transport system permease protein
MPQHIKQTWWRYALVGLLGLLWLVPIYLLLVNGFKSGKEYSFTSPWEPGGIHILSNLQEAWQRGKVGQAIGPTLLYAILGPGLGALIGSAAGFSIIALRLKHGFAWFVVVFAGTVVPIQMLLMPLFVGYARTNVYNTRAGLILIYTAISVPFAAFVMRNFFSGIAREVFEAAAVDGARPWTIFWRIYLPMSAPAWTAVFILEAVIIWNDLILGLVLSQSPGVRPIMPSLAALQSAYGGSALPVVLAGGLIVSVPTVALFLATQKVFSRGIALGN